MANHQFDTLLSESELLRYNRQITLPKFDFSGQESLKSATILIVGLGGLGCAAAQYLAVAGVGCLILNDFDHVSLSNLQRQILHHDARLGMSKVHSAYLSLQQLNPHVQLVCYDDQLSLTQLQKVIGEATVVLDCSDNLACRNQVNQCCYQAKIPLISAAAIRMEGQLVTFTYEETSPCYHCLSALMHNETLSCIESGIMSPLVGIVGAMQAMQAIKLISHYGTITSGQLLLIDATTLQFTELSLTKQPHCPVCGS